MVLDPDPIGYGTVSKPTRITGYHASWGLLNWLKWHSTQISKIKIVANLFWKDMQCLRSCTPLEATGNNDMTHRTVCLVCTFSIWQPLSCTFMIPGFVVVLCNTAGRKELGMHCKWSLSKAGHIGCWRIWGSCGMMLSRIWDSRLKGRGALMSVSICMLCLPIW